MGEPGFVFKVNPLFLLVIVLLIFAGLGIELLIAFILVISHEFVHLLVAWLSGYEIYKIDIFPFGGMAEYRGLLEMDPWQEIKVAICGPLFNLVLVLILYLYYGNINFISIYYIDLLIKYKLIIGVFNLLPALPLDGGRILRSVLVARMGFCRGTMMAVKIAKFFAISGAILGIIALIFQQTNIWILFISFFVYGAAIKEEKNVVYYLVSYLTHRKDFIDNMIIKPVYLQVSRSNVRLKDMLTYLVPDKFNLFYIPEKEYFLSEIQLLDYFFAIEDRDVRIGKLIKDKVNHF